MRRSIRLGFLTLLGVVGLTACGVRDPQGLLTITSPVDGSTISGSVMIEAMASGDAVVEQVDFYLEDIQHHAQLIGTCLQGPFQHTLDSLQIANGHYTITAIGIVNGKSYVRMILVRVANNVTVELPPVPEPIIPVDR